MFNNCIENKFTNLDDCTFGSFTASGIVGLKRNMDKTKSISAIRQRVGWGRPPARGYGTIQKLLNPRHKKYIDRVDKVTVVGVGSVGIATIFALLAQKVTANIVMVDQNENRLNGEVMDLQHASSFLYEGNVSIQGCTDYSKTKDSSICVITAGVRQKTGETRNDLVQRNVEVLKNIVPELVKRSPKTILVVASNPVDILTYLSWKISGLQKNRVIGSGTNLDSGRFRYLLARRLCIASHNCHGYIIGEHGDRSVAIWSSVNIAGVRLRDLNPNIGKDGDSENWKAIHSEVVQSAYTIVKLKGYTSSAIGLCLSHIVKCILINSTCVQAVSTYAKGEHGVKEEVFLSLPCVLGRSGVLDVIRQPLSDYEREQFCKAATLMAELQAKIKI